jgi:hypothetical protein
LQNSLTITANQRWVQNPIDILKKIYEKYTVFIGFLIGSAVKTEAIQQEFYFFVLQKKTNLTVGWFFIFAQNRYFQIEF